MAQNTYETDKNGRKVLVSGAGAKAPEHNTDQDITHGPGVVAGADGNTYEVDANGRRVIVSKGVSGGPRHNADQDPEHGPGIEK